VVFPNGMIKRWHGYGLRKCHDQPTHWTQLLSGSEGTLAVIAGAELNILPLPKEKGLGLLFFDSATDAMQASVDVTDLKPSAIEHIDRIFFDQTRGQLLFHQARSLLELDNKPCESILMVEFHEIFANRLDQLGKRRLGKRRLMLQDSISMQLVWQLCKAGLSLLTGCKGAAKPTTGIEDTAVCPSNVDMALIKAELQQVMRDRYGATLFQWLFGHLDWIAEWASHFPAWSNRMQSWNWLRRRLEKPFNLFIKRPLPNFANQLYDRWFAQRVSNRPTPNGPVCLWDDTFARYYDPHIRKAAVKVLECLGFEVRLLFGRRCCGRPSFSQSDLRRARRLGQHNIDLIERNPKAPILFLEPSCFSMFREDYTELGVKGADTIANRCHLLEAFLAQQCEKDPEWRDRFHPPQTPAVTHVHCHAKALTKTSYIQHLKQHL